MTDPCGGAARDEGPGGVRRREFLTRVSVALSLWGAAIVGIPFVGFLVAPLFETTEPVWRPVGPATAFRVGTTTEVAFADSSPLPWAGVVARTAAWLRRDGDDAFIAYSVNCTHLGCPVRWLPDANLFMCPCHGGVYYGDGTVAAGPPPRPLPRYPVRVRDGQVEILTSPLPITTD
ncbi:MAG TPA: Rieske 2Fe-2S domain-containing protein [bacterium]|nr:Rieske 2Fe-2S domain-containing protein [bacterium]